MKFIRRFIYEYVSSFLFHWFVFGNVAGKRVLSNSNATLCFFFAAFEGNALRNVPVYASRSIGTNFCVTEERKLFSVYVVFCRRKSPKRFHYFLLFPWLYSFSFFFHFLFLRPAIALFFFFYSQQCRKFNSNVVWCAHEISFLLVPAWCKYFVVLHFLV